MADQRTLARLQGSAEWEELRALVAEETEKYFRNLAKTLFANPSVIDPASLHYKRGFFRGMLWLLEQPSVNAKKLAKAADQEEETTDE